LLARLSRLTEATAPRPLTRVAARANSAEVTVTVNP